MGDALSQRYRHNEKVLSFVENGVLTVTLEDDDQLHDTLIEFTRRHPELLGDELDGHLRTDLLLKLLTEAKDEATQVIQLPYCWYTLCCIIN